MFLPDGYPTPTDHLFFFLSRTTPPSTGRPPRRLFEGEEGFLLRGGRGLDHPSLSRLLVESHARPRPLRPDHIYASDQLHAATMAYMKRKPQDSTRFKRAPLSLPLSFSSSAPLNPLHSGSSVPSYRALGRDLPINKPRQTRQRPRRSK